MFTLHHQVLSPLLSIVSPTPLPDHQKRKGKLRQQTENYVSCIRLDPENKTKKRQKKESIPGLYANVDNYLQMLTKIPGPLSQCYLQMLTPSLYWKMTLWLWKASLKCNEIDQLRWQNNMMISCSVTKILEEKRSLAKPWLNLKLYSPPQWQVLVLLFQCGPHCVDDDIGKSRASLTCVQCLSPSGSPPRVFWEFSAKRFSTNSQGNRGQQEGTCGESLQAF